MSNATIRIYSPNGLELRTYRNRMEDWLPFQQEVYHWWKKLPCEDPRYGRVEDLATGEELRVRHSTQRDARTSIVLKRVRNGRVAQALADYDRRSFNGFCYACVEADKTLAQMAGLI